MESRAQTDTPTLSGLPPGLDDLAARAFELDPVPPYERAGLMRDEAAALLDGLLVRVARGRGALDVAIGEGLAALAVGDHVLRLGFSGIGDFARERLGIAGATALATARLARELRDRPLLREAVRRGEVSARKAQVVLPVARGGAEASWVVRARGETVRALAAAVRAEGEGAAGPTRCPGEDAAADGVGEPWARLAVPLDEAARAKLDRAMALAGKALGAAAPRWQRLEAICEEYLGAHPVEAHGDAEPDDVFSGPIAAPIAEVKAALEVEAKRWDFLEAVAPVAAPAGAGETDPWALDAELRRLAALRERWDELVGHLAMLVKNTGVWRDMLFASFGHYCEERLGMATRTVEQRAALARRLYALPALREALRGGRVSYEQARLVASVADDRTEAEWIARAERVTCVALRREVERDGEAQMCRRGALDLRAPRRVTSLLSAAFRAAREAEGAWLAPARCLERIAEHFIATWERVPEARSTPAHRAVARDGGLCQVPGCSRAAAHAHHVRYRSAGGGDDPANLVALCAAHHLHGVHAGYVRVSGRAPGALRWELGVRPGLPPLLVA